MNNCHISGISPLNGVKKPLFRPEKWHGFGAAFYSVHDTSNSSGGCGSTTNTRDEQRQNGRWLARLLAIGTGNFGGTTRKGAVRRMLLPARAALGVKKTLSLCTARGARRVGRGRRERHDGSGRGGAWVLRTFIPTACGNTASPASRGCGFEFRTCELRHVSFASIDRKGTVIMVRQD